MKEFKVGDYVKVVKVYSEGATCKEYMGEVGTICGIMPDSEWPYLVHFDEKHRKLPYSRFPFNGKELIHSKLMQTKLK